MAAYYEQLRQGNLVIDRNGNKFYPAPGPGAAGAAPAADRGSMPGAGSTGAAPAAEPTQGTTCRRRTCGGPASQNRRRTCGGVLRGQWGRGAAHA